MQEAIRKSIILFGIITIVCLPQTGLFAQQFGPGPGAGPGPGGTAETALTNFETTYFSGSGICAFCHSNLTDSSGNDVSNDAHWRSTMMANSAKDPLWQAKIESEVNRNSHLQGVIEDKCTRCHMGMARYQADTDGTDVGVLGNGFLDSTHPLHEAAMDGVSCTLCHQVEAHNLGFDDSFTGQYTIDVTKLRPDRLIFGPYEDPAPLLNPMNNNTGFIPTHGAHMKNAGLCGSCHTLYTPIVNEFGIPTGDEFPEQMTYLEWEHSGADESCQECHIAEASGPVAISNRPRRLQAREPFGQHHFVGGNSFMVDILKNNQAELGITADTVHLDDTITRTMDQLETHTATLVFSTLPTLVNESITMDVTVSNLAGHKFPTGFPSRRTWLHMMVTDKKGAIIFESGEPLFTGQIVGNDADFNDTAFEPHWDIIDSEEKVQIYEAVMVNTKDEVTWTLLRAASYVKDNRLLPNGFDNDDADPDFSVKGVDATDSNFQGGEDTVTYRVNIPKNAKGPFTVTVELLFQSVSYPFAINLQVDNTTLVNRFTSQYEVADKTPVVLATAKREGIQ